MLPTWTMPGIKVTSNARKRKNTVSTNEYAKQNAAYDKEEDSPAFENSAESGDNPNPLQIMLGNCGGNLKAA